MSGRIMLLSIRPEYAVKIFSGDKVVELRRTRPRLNEGDVVMVYASSPQKALIGVFEVKQVVQKPLNELWKDVKDKAGITYQNFRSYYKGLSIGCGIYLNKTHCFEQPIKLEFIRKDLIDFRPPQSYRYLTSNEIVFLKDKILFDASQFGEFCQTTLNLAS